ncbi:MAG: YraN family protein [Patescibacteria group bacterium]|nr:YraN family protein [Patescibacteria group bacterium]
MDHNSIGEIGEKIAANFLLAQGYELLDANQTNQRGYQIGELDLIVKDKKENIVFVEVKTGKGKAQNVIPEENITSSKIIKIQKAANHYLRVNNLLDKNWRIDAVVIVLDFFTRKMSIRHIKHIRI